MNLESIQIIVTNCDKLTELNLEYTNLCPKSILYLCNNLTFNIAKLSLARLKVNNEHVHGMIEYKHDNNG